MTAEAKRKCENCIYMYRLHKGKHPNTMYCGHTIRTNEYCSTQNWKNKCNKGQTMSDARPIVGKWIPVKYGPLTVNERIAFADHYGIKYSDTIDEKAFDCPMPEDGQEILISTRWGVTEDIACNDVDGEGFVCYGLEDHDDWDGVDAWMPMPEPYKKGDEE